MSSCLRGEEVKRKLSTITKCCSEGDPARTWIFSGSVMDYELHIAPCGLCGVPDRFAFEVRQRLTGQSLWIGSGCLMHHGFTILRDGQPLAYGPAQGYVSTLIRDMRRQAWFNGLMQTYSMDDHPALYEALVGYQVHGHFTPVQAANVFQAMEKQKTRYDPSCFRIDLKTPTCRKELRRLPPWEVWRFWSVLTPQQQITAKKLGHREPPPSSRPAFEERRCGH